MQKYQHNVTNGENMADKLGLGSEIRELKLGPSFTNSRGGDSFHTLRYDFKPASVDVNKIATVDVGSNNQVTLTVPHLDGAGTSHTVFKGSQRPCQKECVIIIDRVTGEITLEKLTTNIQVKKTRLEAAPKLALSLPHPTSRPLTPVESMSNSQSKSKLPSPQHKPNKKKTSPKPHLLAASASGSIPRHSPLRASPSYSSSRSPPRVMPPQHKSPSSQAASLPVLRLEEEHDLGFGSSYPTFHRTESPEYMRPVVEEDRGMTVASSEVGILSESSDSSDSDSSDSDSDPVNSTITANGHLNGTASPSLSLPDHILSEDLHLSESNSDSD
ncbi:hypothetical protein L9F63_010848 [Diploptera punctata]|uniref:Ell-associated factor Eaf n=1 Tax=Diploptera punctata TaxID=6984 RepID=A0AAD8EQV9_DIPPU|nr:hypothetical protein L9F63_010848 [Diploptera punctata]